VARRVAIGAAGTTTAFGIVATLKERWPTEVEVVAVDINERRLVASAALADSFTRGPAVADPGYADWLARFLVAEGIDLYVPLIDADIVTAAELAAAGETGAARVVAPPVDAARICLDKLATFEWLAEREIATPATWLPGDAPPAGADAGDLIVKPRHGLGSSGFRRLAAEAELAAAVAESDEELVVQSACEPPEVTIDAFRGVDGGFRAICRERLEVKAGVCTKAQVFESEELAALVGRIAADLEIRGPFCVQVMREGDRWSVTDLNARSGGGTRLSTAAGVDILAAAYADLLDLPLPADATAPLREDVFAVRQPSEYVVR
jgi:carbamoylphosphate synthase large subunit